MLVPPKGVVASLLAPLVAGSLALVAVLEGWRGVDFSAQLYRIGLFHQQGLTLWDSQWYGGHWTLNYSVIFPPVAGVIGVQATEVLSAAVAAWAFDRLVVGHFGTSARVGSLIFAVGTMVQVSIGQLPFLLGEALALAAIWAATRRRWRLAAALAVATPLASPLAGSFLALAAVAWLLASWPRRRLALGGLVAVAAVPVAALTLLFPGQGAMPFTAFDFGWLLGLFGLATVLIPRSERSLRTGALLYVVAIVLSFVVPSSMGSNISRLGECVGAPLAACLLWPHRRLLVPFAVVPLALLQWGPSATSFTGRSDPSTQTRYFQPLLGYLGGHDHPAGRVEIVPTARHWEAAYVAPYYPLARGWERQLDTANNALFYAQGQLDAASYRAWLLDNGVRYVALPDVPLDYAAVQEGRLVQSGVPGLVPAWHDRNWRLFEVAGSTGLVDGPARLVRMDGGNITLDTSGPGVVLVRVRYNSRWSVAEGNGCIYGTPSGWTTLVANQAGPFHLALDQIPASQSGC
ncbi:MAG TPA: hypothetical protein VH112_14235 [Acidimicrobiales bacterium]|nr:hypothetical protein [Acidimicrobiales bacterium]